MIKAQLVILWCILGLSVVTQATVSNPCSSILDVDQLTAKEKTKIRAEVQQFQASRTINNQAVCVQVDFLEQLPPVQSGFTEDGRRVIRQSIYDQWQTGHFGQPAVLFLFVRDQEQGRFVLNDMVISRPVAQQVPTLIRLYIRDEIVKKQTTHYDAISAGVYAFGEALNGEYKERLVEESEELLDKNFYYRGYTYYPLYYFYFAPFHQQTEDTGCDHISYLIDGEYHQLYLLENQQDEKIILSDKKATLLDMQLGRGVGYQLSTHGNKQEVPFEMTERDIKRVYSKNLDQMFKQDAVLSYVYEHFDFSGASEYSDTKDLEEKGNGNYLGLSDAISKIKENDFHFKEWKYVKKQSPFVYNNHTKHCRCLVQVITGTKNKGEAYTTLEGLSTYGKTHFQGAQCTMCNHYASDLSAVFGTKRGVPADKSSGSLVEIFKKESEYINLRNIGNGGKELFWKYINLGYPVYFCKSGHIETGYPSGHTNIGHKKKYEDEFETSEISSYDATTTYHTIGAGAETGMKHYDGFSFLSDLSTGAFLYLGYLKKQ